jgi:transcriptional regulator
MYNPAHFVEDRADVLTTFIHEHPLAVLVTCGADGPEASHVPMVFHPETGPHGVLRCHLARANSQWKSIADSSSVLAVFAGAEHYITPGWYPSTQEHGKVVPTWNYVAVHIRGRGRLMQTPDELLAHLKELTGRNEQPFENPWTVESAPAEYIHALTNAIVGIEITVSSMEGKWKASQNRTRADREGVVAGLTELNTSESLAMSEIVKKANGL